MDGTPYPPPTPSVPPSGNQQPPYPAHAPQAQYAPAAPQPQYAPQAPYSPAQPPKKKIGLIIGIVVAALLLCCCGTGAAGYFAYQAARDETAVTLDEIATELDSDTLDLDTDATEDEGPAARTGWENFAPGTYDPSVWVALEPYHQEVLDEAAATLFPDFEVTDVLVRPATEYTTDTVLARATLGGETGTEIAFYLEVENTAAFDSGWEDDPATQEYDYLDHGVAANGREYYWDNTQLVPLLGGINDSTTQALLVTVADHFPGAVIYLVENDAGAGDVEFTIWDAYPDYDTGYSAHYTYDGSSWVLDSAEQW